MLETTDLHMQLLDYDYFADRPDPHIGLIGLADQISALREEKGVTTLLCDNGDLIQGNPLADYVANHFEHDQTHPMIAALNVLQYDAMTLGNHEFDYGLQFLRQTLSKAAFPIVSANIRSNCGDPLAAPFTILEREILLSDGTRRPIKIGITGFGPPQISDWNDRGGGADVCVEDIIDAAHQIVPKMQAAGTDLIIALCHSGISSAQSTSRMENAAIPLAAVEGIDVLLTGHTHQAFPNPSIADTPDVDYTSGSLHKKPTVMANFCGKSLGVIDLDLHWKASGWSIADQTVRLEHARLAEGDETLLRQNLRALVAKPHAATLAKMRAPIARTAIPIFSYFATVQPDLSQQLLARAMQEALCASLAQTKFAALPVLAAKSSYRFGGRSGLGHYIDIPAGPITLRDAAAIFPFADVLCGVRRTGRQLRLWLERSAAHYNQLRPGHADQPLINPQSAGYNCDALYGLTYQIDLTQPARFDTNGQEIDATAHRITDLKHKGTLISDDAVFVVATNSFRTKGGGGFPEITPSDIVYQSTRSVREQLIAHLKQAGTIIQPVQPNWCFAPIPKTCAQFDSAPQARHHLNDPIRHIGPGADGFETYQINF